MGSWRGVVRETGRRPHCDRVNLRGLVLFRDFLSLLIGMEHACNLTLALSALVRPQTRTPSVLEMVQLEMRQHQTVLPSFTNKRLALLLLGEAFRGGISGQGRGGRGVDRPCNLTSAKPQQEASESHLEHVIRPLRQLDA